MWIRYRHHNVLKRPRTRAEMPSFTELPPCTELPPRPELLAFIRRYDEGEEFGCYKAGGTATEGSSLAELAQHG